MTMQKIMKCNDPIQLDPIQSKSIHSYSIWFILFSHHFDPFRFVSFHSAVSSILMILFSWTFVLFMTINLDSKQQQECGKGKY